MAAGVAVELCCARGAYHEAFAAPVLGAQPGNPRTVRAGEFLMLDAIAAALA